jgi:hypothetical protein
LQEGIDVIRDKDKVEIVDINISLDAKQGLKAHNDVRVEVFDKALRWSNRLQKDAQDYANILANSGKFEHDPKNREKDYGENLYASININGKIPTFKDAVDNWAVEERYYNYSDNSCSVDASNTDIVDITTYNTCGHYTQIIWKSTSLLGCAKAKYKTGDLKDGYIIVCKYSSPGNIEFNGRALKPY